MPRRFDLGLARQSVPHGRHLSMEQLPGGVGAHDGHVGALGLVADVGDGFGLDNGRLPWRRLRSAPPSDFHDFDDVFPLVVGVLVGVQRLLFDHDAARRLLHVLLEVLLQASARVVLDAI